MNKAQIIDVLNEKNLTDMIKLIKDAESGKLEELELFESIGLVNDTQLNMEVINLLKQLGVTITYVTYDDGELDSDTNA